MATMKKEAHTPGVTIVSRTYGQSFVLHPEDDLADKLAFEQKGARKPEQKEPTTPYSDTPQPPHRPEIVLTEPAPSAAPAYTPTHAYKPQGLLPAPSIVCAVCALCLVSFLLGCTLTDSAFCQVVVAINSAVTGRLPDNLLSEVSATSDMPDDRPTVYQKYRDQQQKPMPDYADPYYLDARADGNGSSNLEAFHESPAENTSALSGSTALAVQNTDGGKIGSDGAVFLPVLSRNIAASSLFALSNETRYTPDLAALGSQTPKALENLTVSPDSPLVLVVHTHGTESYNDRDDGYYDKNAPFRSEDTEKNVVSIGKTLADVLNGFGIPTLHSEKMCDKDSFLRAYSTSASEVKAYLEKYPSIRFVIDLHRDSIADASGTKTKPVFSYAGENTAQLMFVVGTDAAGAKHPGWQDNLSLALTLQSAASATAPELFRPLNLRTASFNQQLSAGYLLLECGSCANTHTEADRAARLFATEFARVIKKHQS